MEGTVSEGSALPPKTELEVAAGLMFLLRTPIIMDLPRWVADASADRVHDDKETRL
jgi:hypothetical protein